MMKKLSKLTYCLDVQRQTGEPIPIGKWANTRAANSQKKQEQLQEPDIRPIPCSTRVTPTLVVEMGQ